MKIRHLIAVIALSIAGSAFAAHCPVDMKKIDEALAKKPDISDAQLTEVKKLRADGEAFHKSGKHAESMEALGKAMKVLGIK
jgi:hypothetical protein